MIGNVDAEDLQKNPAAAVPYPGLGRQPYWNNQGFDEDSNDKSVQTGLNSIAEPRNQVCLFVCFEREQCKM